VLVLIGVRRTRREECYKESIERRREGWDEKGEKGEIRGVRREGWGKRDE
jgi:hypothetical protein